MKVNTLGVFLLAVLCQYAWGESNESEDYKHSMLFYHYRSALNEGYNIYFRLTDSNSKKIVGCSIKNNVLGLKAYVDLDLPPLIKDKKTLLFMVEIADKEWTSLKNNTELFSLQCDPLDKYWDVLAK